MDINKSIKNAKKQAGKLNKYIPKVDIPKIEVPNVSVKSVIPKVEIPEIELDPEKTIVGDIKHELQEQSKLYAKQMEEQRIQFSQQIELLTTQNQLLNDNYNKLKDLYEKQIEAYDNSQIDLEKSRNYNRWMMVIAIIAMLAAIAGPIVTLMAGK